MRKWKNPAKDLSPLKAHRSRGIRNGGSKKKKLEQCYQVVCREVALLWGRVHDRRLLGRNTGG